jgi:hypothetical protein
VKLDAGSSYGCFFRSDGRQSRGVVFDLSLEGAFRPPTVLHCLIYFYGIPLSIFTAYGLTCLGYQALPAKLACANESTPPSHRSCLVASPLPQKDRATLRILRVGQSSHCYALIAHRLRVKSYSSHSIVKRAAVRKYSCRLTP